MSDVVLVSRSLVDQVFGTGSVPLLDPVHIVKDKLRARATCNKHHNQADLRFLKRNFRADLQQESDYIKLAYADLAMKRSSELKHPFSRISLDLNVAKLTSQRWTWISY